jgi:hypothetical protein
MSSLLTEFKQVPVNAGYYVCISGATSITWDVSGDGNVGAVNTGAIALGAQYMDLGVTRVTRNGTPIPAAVYRKVVPVTVPMGVNPTEVYIKIGATTANFARMG